MARSPPPEGASHVPAVEGTPTVFVGFLTTQEVELPGALPQRLLHSVGDQEHARALELESGVETGKVEEGTLAMAEAVVGRRDLVVESEGIESEQAGLREGPGRGMVEATD